VLQALVFGYKQREARENHVMNTLLLLLLLIFAGVALMVILGERFAKPADADQMHKLQRWLYPLVGLALVLSLLNHYL
jgi:cadmium resistance protein CadD (predicted permease)